MKILKNIIVMSDAYKLSHREQYPEGTEEITTTLVARTTKNAKTVDGKVIFFGVTYLIEELKLIEKDFFKMSKTDLQETEAELTEMLGKSYDMSAWYQLHELGYFPVEIRGVEEFKQYDIQTPLLTITNTHPDFFWLPNFLETYILQTLWQASTSATISHYLYYMMKKHYEKTTDTFDLLPFAAHDFSARGMSSFESSVISGLGHLAFFQGTDTVAAMDRWKKLYGEHRGYSVPATEHSVMCAAGEENELKTFQRILNLYPEGIISIVADGYDYFRVLDEYLPILKEQILNRNGKTVIRPDSGSQIKIICGDKTKEKDSPEYLGSLAILGNIFGYTINKKGYKVLNPKIGLIYGDSMTVELIDDILTKMEEDGWAADNIIFGVGSYTYQHNTRDTYGFVMKATHAIINNKDINIIKTPKTDPNKKSITGKPNLPIIYYSNQK